MKIVKKTLFYILASLMALQFLLPLIWMILSSFKIDEVIYKDIDTIFAFVPRFSDLSFDSYVELLGFYNIFKNVGNSLIYASVTVVVGLTINSLAGYALARFKFPFKDWILIFIIALMIVPIEATILPLFLVVNEMGLINTIPGYLLPFIINVMNIFLFRQHFLSFPGELIESGKIDGLSEVGCFFRIVMPSSLNMYITVGILTFLASWNDFLWPVMALSNADLMPIQVALNAVFADKYNIFTSHMMAALTIVMIPIVILYIIFQKYIVEGSMQSGIK
ncbi:carbohydrate ABC transporter permease [Bacillus sp. ISL-40]|uniref:carbohydrate ABC transporter permease n=1 Tax=unclassified Bacillus (in: firmicutes) TaxID=185979 RepID=UPI001BEA1084|nr:MULTISPECIES: carbohydrate ABC transporter permease [unclassified Bacillus (in: firmicutes)]MBT2698988.1 carbohydrate ABC transporter permease [Bacillus sp. ISL-40]MBT2744716.1 carbohydrate ABC transporter permease [Bacillus sp. ISL-77]